MCAVVSAVFFGMFPQKLIGYELELAGIAEIFVKVLFFVNIKGLGHSSLRSAFDGSIFQAEHILVLTYSKQRPEIVEYLFEQETHKTAKHIKYDIVRIY